MARMSPSASSPGDKVGRDLDRLVARVDEDRWLSSRYAPPGQRAQLVALYGLNYELARIRLAVSEPTLGAIRFQWWREALEGLGEGAGAGRHAVTAALAPVVEAGGVPVTGLQGLVDGHQDAFEASDRGLEPEGALAELAARLLDREAAAAAAGWIVPAAEAFAAARRGGAGEQRDGAMAAGRVPAVLRPALAHIALRRAYAAAGAGPSPLAKRLVVLRAVLSGRI